MNRTVLPGADTGERVIQQLGPSPNATTEADDAAEDAAPAAVAQLLDESIAFQPSLMADASKQVEGAESEWLQVQAGLEVSVMMFTYVMSSLPETDRQPWDGFLMRQSRSFAGSTSSKSFCTLTQCA